MRCGSASSCSLSAASADAPHLPPGPVCPFCFSDRLAWHPALGTGKISTWTVVHKAWFPAFAADVPYNVVQVELDEGPRLTASVVGLPNERLAVGLRVVIDFDDATPEITLPRFRLAERRMNQSLILLENLLQALIAGLLIGSVYALMCVGLGFIFGVMRVINFAQGEFLMLGMYATLYAFTWLGLGKYLGPYLGPIVGAAIAGVLLYVVGILLHRFFLARVTGFRVFGTEGEGHYPQLILTLGLSLIFANAGLIFFGSTPENIRTPLSATAWELGPLAGDHVSMFFNKARSVAFVVSIAAAIALYLFVTRSRIGKQLRAAADNPEAATYMGIDVDRAHRIAFGLGCAITALAGGTGRDLLPVPAVRRPRVRHHHVRRRRARRDGQHRRRVLGRPHHRARAAALDAVPAGAAAERGDLRRVPADRPAAPRRPLRPERGSRVTSARDKPLRAIFWFAAAYLALGLLIRNEYYQLMLTLVLVWAIMGVSWNVFSGYSGLVSFGHASFFGLGAYTVTLLLVKLVGDAVDRHPDRDAGRRRRRRADRLSDVPPARRVLLARDARLPARAALRLRVARLPGGAAADEDARRRPPTCSSPTIAPTS